MAEEQKKENNENFQYIVRIANKDLDGERPLSLALADLRGVGHRLARIIVNVMDLPYDKRIGEFTEEEVEKMREFIESEEYENIPVWALNHRNETVTGKDLNLVTNELDLQIQDDINAMKKMRSYRGIRHDRGQKVRGQRTKSKGRRGLAVGVLRRKEGGK